MGGCPRIVLQCVASIVGATVGILTWYLRCVDQLHSNPEVFVIFVVLFYLLPLLQEPQQTHDQPVKEHGCTCHTNIMNNKPKSMDAPATRNEWATGLRTCGAPVTPKDNDQPAQEHGCTCQTTIMTNRSKNTGAPTNPKDDQPAQDHGCAAALKKARCHTNR